MESIVCPHCHTTFVGSKLTAHLAEGLRGNKWTTEHYLCPACERIILYLVRSQRIEGSEQLSPSFPERQRESWRIWPKGTQRPPVPPEVPPGIAEDYTEACLVVADSPKAGAALARRCLQNLLRSLPGVNHADLWKEIDQVIGTLPSHLADSIDAVRHIGNFAAHPNKSQQTGEIVDVEPGEAEWTLDTLELLFDFYFVQPALTRAKRQALDAKLADAGKPPMR